MLDTPLMLWELSVTEQRYQAVLEVLAGVPVTEVAEQYGVRRESVHTWLGRHRSEGPPGLADRSHKVRAHPWQIPAELELAGAGTGPPRHPGLAEQPRRYQAAGRAAEAILLFEQALVAFERVLGPDHPDTLRSRNNLAATYREAGRPG